VTPEGKVISAERRKEPAILKEVSGLIAGAGWTRQRLQSLMRPSDKIGDLISVTTEAEKFCLKCRKRG
jgi:hypothetical protein